jgi:hypothetical protein
MLRLPLHPALLRTLVLTGLMAASSSIAFAQEEGEGDRRVSYKQTTEIDFEGLDVNGELVKPSSALVLDRKKANFNPLIKLRADFNMEMEQSVDEVK